MKENMGQIIKRLRKERNLTQEELAEQLNISAQAISKWEKRVKLKGVRLNECKDNKLSITLLFENYGDLTMELGK